MTADARKEELFHELDKLRSRGERTQGKDIVRLARKAGLTGREALRELSRFDPFRLTTSGQSNDVLPLFISAVCEQGKASG